MADKSSKQTASYWNLINPLSPVMGGGDKYPEFVANMFPGNPKAAWMVSKTGALALLAGATLATIRGVQHLSRVSRIGNDDDDPANKLKSQIATTYEVPLGKRASAMPLAPPPQQIINLPKATSLENIAYVAIPTSAMLLAGTAAWHLMDNFADARRNKKLKDSIDAKTARFKDLVQLRARIAKGSVTPAEMARVLGTKNEEDEAYVKQARDESMTQSAMRKGLVGFGALLLAMGVMSAGAGYKYFSESNPDNIKYKAMQKGLAEYARAKALMSPITIIPTDADDYFKKIDEGAKPKSIREQPEPVPAVKPISITL